MTEFLSGNPGEDPKSTETTVDRVFGVEIRNGVMVWNPRSGDHQYRMANEADPEKVAQVLKDMNKVNGDYYNRNIDPRQGGLF